MADRAPATQMVRLSADVEAWPDKGGKPFASITWAAACLEAACYIEATLPPRADQPFKLKVVRNGNPLEFGTY